MLFLLIFTLALTTGFAVLFYALDSREKEPVKYILLAIAYGFVAAMLELFVFRVAFLKFFYGDQLFEFTLLLNDEIDQPNLIEATISAVVVGGFLKEGLKVFAFSQLVRRIKLEIDEPFDSIVYAVMVSLGFQLFENLLFVRTEFVTANFFGFMGLLKHLICGVVMGYFHQQYFFRSPYQTTKTIYVVFAVMVQMCVHIVLRLSLIWHSIFSYFLAAAFFVVGLLVVSKLIIDTKKLNT